MASFSGIYPALVTPAHDDFSVDVEALRRMVAFHIESGVDGFWVAGATGEVTSLSGEERRVVTEAVIDASASRAKVIVHVASGNHRESLALAAHAEQCGADAIASIPPYFVPVREQEIIDHYRRLADGCGLPLFAYHLPMCTHVPITQAIVERLLAAEALQGIKFSDFNLADMWMMKNLGGDALSVLYGMDAMFLAGLVMGADGGVGGTYCYMPQVHIQIYQAYKRGNLAAAQNIQRRATTFIRELSCGLGPIVFVKQAMSLMGLDCGPPRPPLLPPSPEQCRLMERCWDDHREWLASLAVGATTIGAPEQAGSA